MKNILFNIPLNIGSELKYIKKSIKNRHISGDGEFTKKCNKWFEVNLKCKKVLLTTSCTHALEMSVILIDIQPGDEVIMPSYTFVSTANAFILRGAKIVFIDVRPDTMNIDENLIEKAVTKKTKAIIVVHYAGVSCEMEKIIELAEKYNLFIIEDAAQGIMSRYKNQYLGTIGDLGCLSFHETKNITCGEGGALLINNEKFIERAEIIREKGTDRSKFFKGQVDKYTWIDIGSSYLPSELNAAFLYAQLCYIKKITEKRVAIWNTYYNGLKELEDKGYIELQKIPDNIENNGHLFYIKTKNIEERTDLIDFLKKQNISTVYHYIPLHTSIAGIKYGKFFGIDKYTTRDSERLLRLPLYYNLSIKKVTDVAKKIKLYYSK